MVTILVDKDLCTRCGTCATICPSRIIEPSDENILPFVQDAKAGSCIMCGHCEAYCPSQALLLNIRPEEKTFLPAGAGALSPVDLGYYMKKRRSVRHYTEEPVPKETIETILDIARYAASGGNGQPVEWIVIHNTKKVLRIAGLTIDWMRTLMSTSHPMSGYVSGLIKSWDAGNDVICRGAPHLIIAHIPAGNPINSIDATIALTYVDIAAPAFGVGTCWAGFVAGAASEYEPLQREIGIPPGRKMGYAMMFGNPKFKICGIPCRKPLEVEWK